MKNLPKGFEGKGLWLNYELILLDKYKLSNAEQSVLSIIRYKTAYVDNENFTATKRSNQDLADLIEMPLSTFRHSLYKLRKKGLVKADFKNKFDRTLWFELPEDIVLGSLTQKKYHSH